MIKYETKDEPFIIIDIDRKIVYDSKFGLIDMEALSLKIEISDIDTEGILPHLKLLTKIIKCSTLISILSLRK